jgi:MFS family permease
MIKTQSSQAKSSRFYYGYIIVFVSLVIMIMGFGVNYSFSVFFNPLSSEFSWSKAVTSAAYSICNVVGGFLGIFAGKLTDRFGPKFICLAGGCLMGLGCILMSQIQTIWQFYLIYAFLISMGIAPLWPVLATTVPKWFLAKRGFLVGVVAAGIGLSQVIFPPIVSRLIPAYGWRMSYVILGIIVLVFIVIASLFFKPEPHKTGQLMYGEEKLENHVPKNSEIISFQAMIHNRVFWLLCLIYFCFGYGLHSVLVHIVPHAINVGITPQTAAIIISVIGGISVISKILAGVVSSRIGVNSALIFYFLIFVIGLVWLLFAPNLWALCLFGIIFGFAYGGIITLQSLISAELFGLNSLGLIVGSVAFCYTIGAALGPFISGYIFDTTTSYHVAFILCIALALVAIVLDIMGIMGFLRKQEKTLPNKT